MVLTVTPLPALTAQDVMSREVVTIPRQMSLGDAARLLRSASVSAAPVVDEQGRCVGVLSAADFLRWAEDGCPEGADGDVRTCCYQVAGKLLGSREAGLCTLAEGACPLQAIRQTADGRRTAVCLQPAGRLCDWQQVHEAPPAGAVSRYMTADGVTASPDMPLHELARMMVDAHIHRVPVVDGRGRPIGVVSGTDVLAAVARDGRRAGSVNDGRPY
jgi:CBS domain-containing protein